MSQQRALVIGGSMSGLLAAIMLDRSGWKVDVFERAPGELAGRGAGIVAQPGLIARLDMTRSPNARPRHRKFAAANPRSRGSCNGIGYVPAGFHGLGARLPAAADAFLADHYHRGLGLAGFEQDGRGIVAHFTDGSTAEGAVLVGADGLRSTVRQQCIPAIAPQYAGYVAWRAMISESALPAAIHRNLFDAMTFCLPPGEQFLGYPVAGPDNDLQPGRRRYNIIWYRPADAMNELPRLLSDESGTVHSVSIPPALIRRDAIAGMRAAAERLLAPQLRAIVRLIDEPLLQPIYDLASPRLTFGRVAIIGDAAFVARPHVGAGVSKAADDAAALVQALDTAEIEVALHCFEKERLPENNRIIERARHLGAYLQATQSAEERTRSARHGIPEAVLAETAVLDFLDR